VIEAWYDSLVASGAPIKRFIEGLDRSQITLLPDCVDDYVDDENPVRAVA
jgi:hypothetical protein